MFEKIIPSEVKMMFGFKDLLQVPSFVAFTRTGRMGITCSLVKIIAWLEKWMMPFEFLHGYSLKRLTDVVSKSEFDLKQKSCRMISENNLALIRNFRNDGQYAHLSPKTSKLGKNHEICIFHLTYFI